jgi:hypothetical protein
VEWGLLGVERLGEGRDVKLWPGGGRGWDWTGTNTHHVPGIQVADVDELIDHGAKIIVLSRGMQLVLQTSPETLKHLEAHKLEYHVPETREAVRTYNHLAAQRLPAGGLFHSTCQAPRAVARAGAAGELIARASTPPSSSLRERWFRPASWPVPCVGYLGTSPKASRRR